VIGKDERLTLRGNGPRELLFLATAAETAGRCLTMEATYPAQTTYPPEHFHPEQEERFLVLDGALTVRLDGVSRRYGVGESFVVPRGVAHTMHNAEPGETRVRWEIRPALRSADFFAALAAERPEAGKFARLTRLAAIMDSHRREMVLSKPPTAVQRPLFRLLARIGTGMTRARGQR
jgi:quercetin dioxygenase-like cupin family protein